MLRLKRYLKPFELGLLAAFALLFAQALCDLNLPNYMSDIVNVGIQQNGIQHAAPEAISNEGLKFIKAFMTGDEQALVDGSYRDKKGEGRWERLPEADMSALNAAFENAATVASTMAMKSRPAGEKLSEGQALDITKFYAFAPMIQAIPADQMAEIRKAAAATPDMMKKQYGIAFVEGYYKELDMDIAGIQRDYIVNIGMRMLLIALLGGGATVLVGLLSARIAAGVAKKLRSDVFAKVESFSSAEVNKFGAASLITRTTNDITQIQQLLQFGVRMILYAPIMCAGGILMATGKSPSMSWIIALAGAVLISLIVTLFSIVMPKFRLIQKLVDKLNLVSREHLSGLLVIRAFGTEKHEEQRFGGANQDLTRVNLFVFRAMGFMMPVMTLIMSGVSLLTVWVGAHQVAQSSIQVGDMMAFMQYSMQIIMSFLMMSMMFVFIPRAQVSANRIADVLDTQSSIVDPVNPKRFDPAAQGLVEFRDVSFKYQGAEEYALKDISFAALPGQTTAIIGSTGSGKSTIANMILRFYDATEGAVLVDGVDVRDVPQAQLRQKIGYVPQKGVLISGTIESNIKYGNRQASEAEVREAAEVAQALSFIEEKPKGLADEIAQGGDNVSGGQKQRLSIARALAKHPEILVFDDSFSALDFKTDVALRKALRAHTADGTFIIVAQRVSTILHAEQIIVLDEGKIVGRGTHRELLQSCPEYREIAGSQLSEEELA